ncbi:hypothetical protein EVAR_30979_1 [Eumeta japonica]|uniref:Uncharacterized protein n=1 Tax=Eumeta variegata TaxID=151549 RepID=A0A4C1W9X0_EUMVA|nr:hypothetical protein EVAR_30979_1 [Eumeta japonica]
MCALYVRVSRKKKRKLYLSLQKKMKRNKAIVKCIMHWQSILGTRKWVPHGRTTRPQQAAIGAAFVEVAGKSRLWEVILTVWLQEYKYLLRSIQQTSEKFMNPG